MHQTGSDGDIGGDGDTGSDGDTSSNSDAGSDGGHVGNKVQGPEMEPEITEVSVIDYVSVTSFFVFTHNSC